MSIFQAFTPEEVESIRSVVMIGHQNDEMLLTNCTRRPIQETRAFIKRFKKYLMYPQTPSSEIADMANKQYVAIITAARAKNKMHPQSLSSAHSMVNLALPLSTSKDSLPLKFRVKFGRFDNENEINFPKPPIPTRSRSVSNDLNREIDEPPLKRIDIPVIPPSNFKFPHAVRNPEEVTPGELAAVLKNTDGPTIICRVIALKTINDTPHALVASFLNEIGPCYVPLHHLVMLREKSDSGDANEQTFTIDKLIKKIMVNAQSIVLAVEDLPELSQQNPIAPELKRSVLYQALAFAAQLQLLYWISNWEIPDNKKEILLREVDKMCKCKYKSTEETNLRCNELLRSIIDHMK